MTGQWAECLLADACSSIDYGLTASASSEPNGPKFLRITDIVDGHIDWPTVPYVTTGDAMLAKYLLHDGDIVLARTDASTGASAFVMSPPRAVFASYLVRLKTKPEFDPRFLAYFLKSEEFWNYIRGVLGDKSAQPNASASTMTKAPLRAPRDLAEQQRIAHILGTLDDKIVLNRRMAGVLEEMARAIFKSWFIDFDPVRAKAESRPTHLPPDLDALFPDSFEGDLPAGWTASTVDEEFDIVMGQSPPGETYNTEGEGTPFYQGRTDFGFRYPTVRVFCTAPTRRAKAGDTLISVRAPVGDINMAAEDCAIGRGVAAARHKSGSRSYTYHFMKFLEPRFKVFESEGTVFGSLGKKDFHNLKVVAPSPIVIRAFENLVAQMDSRLAVCEDETRFLSALRDALLPKLISGEVRVNA